MRCEEFELHVNDLLDQRRSLDSDPVLCAHAVECASCEQLLRGYELLLDAIVGMERVEPTAADVAFRVVAQWQPSLQERPRPLRMRMALALAAGLLVAAVPGLLWLRFRATQEPVLQSIVHDSQAPAATARNLPRPALIDEAREAYQPLIAATSKSLADALNSLPFEDSVAESATDTSRHVERNGEVVAEIRPLAESATRSIVALFRILPGTAASFDAQGLNQ